MRKSFVHLPILAVFAWVGVTATAPGVTVPFTETFDLGDSNWLNGDSSAPTWHASGGIDDSGYISWTAPEFTSAGGFGDPLKLMFRGNNAADASGDAFVGDWLSGGVIALSLSVRHNYTTDLNFYARLAGTGGGGASLANDEELFSIAPNTWTTITILITNSNPPFTSYGSSTFNGVFSNIQNLQFGLYLPDETTFTDLRMDIDNVSIVPEPTTSVLLIMAALGVAGVALRRRQAMVRSSKS